MNNILFFNENPLPSIFTQGTIAGKELRLRAALAKIDSIQVISRKGKTVEDSSNLKITEIEKKIKIHLLSFCPYYLSGFFFFFYGIFLCLKYKPISIEAESPIISGPAVILLGKLFKIRSVIEVRASYNDLVKHKLTFIPLPIKEKLLNWLQFKVLKSANIVITNSIYYQKWLKKYNIKSIVINPGLQNLPSKINFNKNKIITIGYLGRLEPEKGSLILIEAIRLLKQNSRLLKFKVEIAGEGSLKKQLKDKIKNCNLDKVVYLIGFQKNYQILPTWDFLVNPTSVIAPLEMVNAEAAYFKLPVICFGNKDYPETVIDKKTGFKIPNITSGDLAQKIEFLLMNKTIIQNMAETAHSFAKNKYSFDKQVKLLSVIY